MKNIYLFYLIIVICLLGSPLWATTYTFTGNGLWSESSNWDIGVPPSTLPTGDDIVIDCGSGNTCTYDLGTSQNISTGASLTVTSGTLFLKKTLSGMYYEFYSLGTMTISSGATFLIEQGQPAGIAVGVGSMTVNGTLNIGDGDLKTTSLVTIGASASLLINRGSVVIYSSGTLTNNGIITNSHGFIIGDGIWNNSGTYNEGSFTAIYPLGASKFTINGNLLHSNFSSVSFSLEGTTQGTNYGWLSISGAFSLSNLGSFLSASLNNGFTPNDGDYFDVITAGSISGAFTVVSLPSGFALSIVNGNTVRLIYTAPLSVELVNLNVYTEGGKNKIQWQTAQGNGTTNFEIERSNDGHVFNKIGKIHSQDKPTEYSFTDELPIIGTNYYRLRLIDKDGTATFSKIVSVDNKHGKTLNVYPSLVSNGFLTVDAFNTEGGDYAIYNIVGQQVQTGKVAQHLDVSALLKGSYILKIGSEQTKFIKQ